MEPVPEYELDNSKNGTSDSVSAYQQNQQQSFTEQPPTTQYARSTSSGSMGFGSAKKRKLNGDEFPDLGGDAMDGLEFVPLFMKPSCFLRGLCSLDMILSSSFNNRRSRHVLGAVILDTFIKNPC